MEDSFLPESIGSPNAGVDLQEIIEKIQQEDSQFGKNREAQAEHRRKGFEGMKRKAFKA